MRRIIIISIFLLLGAGINSLNAQNNRGDSPWEKFRAEKVSFLTDKLQLTPGEAQKFWPLYNELEKKRWEAQNLRHGLERKVFSSEQTLQKKEVIQLTRDYSGSLAKEAELDVKYNEEFLKILPPEKVLLLYKSENEFRMYMMRKNWGQRRPEPNN